MRQIRFKLWFGFSRLLWSCGSSLFFLKLAFSERCGCNTYLTEFPLETIGIMYVICYAVHCKFPVIYLKILSQGWEIGCPWEGLLCTPGVLAPTKLNFAYEKLRSECLSTKKKNPNCLIGWHSYTKKNSTLAVQRWGLRQCLLTTTILGDAPKPT